MGIILNKGVNEEVIEEFQNCNLYPHDTRNIKQLFHNFRKKRINAKDHKHFGLRINAQQLTEWKSCSLENAAKLISRWKSTVAVKKGDIKQFLDQLKESGTIDIISTKKQIQKDSDREILRKSLSRSLSAIPSPIKSPINLQDIQRANGWVSNQNIKDETEICMLPLFCAMTLMSSGTVSEKLKLIIYLFVDNPHDSISRQQLDVIIENTISAMVVLLDMKEHIDRIRRYAHRHIYQKHSKNSTIFKEISRGSLAIWLATSPYVLHIFCLRNTSDASERYIFLNKFYDEPEKADNFDSDMRNAMQFPTPSVSFKVENRRRRTPHRRSTLFAKSRYQHASVPTLAAIDSSLSGTHLDFSKEQSINLTYKSLSKSWSATQLKRNLSSQPGLARRRDSGFARIDSNVTMYSRKSLGNKRKDDGHQYYGAAVPFDSNPVSMEKILSHFDKHYKLAHKIQSAMRAPALVNKNNARSVVDVFVALSGGKDTISRDDILLGGHSTIITKTLERIFEKCDILKTHTIDIREFLMSQFGSANGEELDRAMSYNKRRPRVYGWTVQCMKKLFDKIAKERYAWTNQQNKRQSRLFLNLNDNDEEEKDAKIKMSDFYALMIHCKELRSYVIRTTRLSRSKSKQMVTFKQACGIIFKECRGFNPQSKKFQVVWSWVTKSEPGLSDEQIVQLKLLFDTMEHKADATISANQLKNATEFIYPGIFTPSLLPYLFYGFDIKEEQHRINCDDFLHFMGYIWYTFQSNFKRRIRNKATLDAQFTFNERLKSTLTATQRSKMSFNFRQISQPNKRGLSRGLSNAFSHGFARRLSRNLTLNPSTGKISMLSQKSSNTDRSWATSRQTTFDQSVMGTLDEENMDIDGDHGEILNFAKTIKDTIKKAGDFSESGSQKMKRYWNHVLSKANAEQAWIKLVLLAIRMVLDNHKHDDEVRDDSLFAYMKELENKDHHSDFKNTQFYTVPNAESLRS